MIIPDERALKNLPSQKYRQAFGRTGRGSKPTLIFNSTASHQLGKLPQQFWSSHDLNFGSC